MITIIIIIDFFFSGVLRAMNSPAEEARRGDSGQSQVGIESSTGFEGEAQGAPQCSLGGRPPPHG